MIISVTEIKSFLILSEANAWERFSGPAMSEQLEFAFIQLVGRRIGCTNWFKIAGSESLISFNFLVLKYFLRLFMHLNSSSRSSRSHARYHKKKSETDIETVIDKRNVCIIVVRIITGMSYKS